MGIVSRAWDILDAVAAAKGTKEKKHLLSEEQDLEVRSVLMEFFRMTMDPFITFGITIDPADPVLTDGPEIDERGWWTQFLVLLDRLRNREVTGNAAKFEVLVHLTKGTKSTGRWAVAMVNRDYTIGVGGGTVEKVFPGLITGFECQLAVEWDGKTIPTNAVVEPKYDGIRGLIFVDPVGGCVALSRNGKQLNNVGHILNELVELCPGFVLDGEFFNEDWSKSVGAVRSSESGDVSARFRVFDKIPIVEFKKQTLPAPLWFRQERLPEICSKCKYVTFIPGVKVATPDEARQAAADWVAKGYEGGVMKSLMGEYEYKRSEEWQKIKFFKSEDAEIVGFEEGNGRNAGRLGAFIVRLNGVDSRVGSMPDAVRDDVWANRDKYLGKMVECKFQELTPDGLMRFPTFLRFRQDKE